MKIPFNKPFIGKEEIACVSQVIRSGMVGGNGPVGQMLETHMQRVFALKHVLLTTSCTHALEMALMALDIRENDQVILPSFSFVSMANAIVRMKAKPVFVDIEDDYLNIDPKKVEAALTKKTKAVLCVHYAGMSCQMNEIMSLARKKGLFVIEDAAQAVGSKYGEKFLGTIGDIGCFSFHGTKNFTCGEGGAFLTGNGKIARKAEIIREKGTNRSAFLRHQVNKYKWLDVGSSFVLSEILAAMLFIQLKRMEKIISLRKTVGLRYAEGLKGLQDSGDIILPEFPPDRVNWHMFYFRLRAQKSRDAVLHALKKKGIEATSHFVPLHMSPYAKKEFKYKAADFPLTQKASASLIRLPIYPGLQRSKQEYIINSLRYIFKQRPL